MSNAFFKVPVAKNEPVLSYKSNSQEKLKLKEAIAKLKSKKI